MLIVAHADAMHQRTSMHLQRVHLSSHRKLRTTLDIKVPNSNYTPVDLTPLASTSQLYADTAAQTKKSYSHHLLLSHSLIVVAAAAATVCPKFARALIGQVYESGRNASILTDIPTS